MGESTQRYCGQKWTLQMTQAQADAAERARRLTGLNRQELLSQALDEFIGRHEAEWRKEFEAKFAVPDDKPASKK